MDPGELWLASVEGAVLWHWNLNLWGLCCLWVVSELSCWTTSWCWRIAGVQQTPHIYCWKKDSTGTWAGERLWVSPGREAVFSCTKGVTLHIVLLLHISSQGERRLRIEREEVLRTDPALTVLLPYNSHPLWTHPLGTDVATPLSGQDLTLRNCARSTFAPRVSCQNSHTNA